MNWTGGRLCRSRNANSSISAKQKNHFAKARAKLQSAQSSTPKRQPFDLGHWRPDYETTHVSPSSSSQQHGHFQHQTILDDYENVRPLVQKLQTLNQLSDSHKRKRPSLEHCVHHVKTEESGGKAMSPIIISSRPSSASSAQSSAPAIATNEDPPRLDSQGSSGLTSIEAKRRRLLQMEDWVGVERRHSKPAHMTFTAAEDRDMIGKRRQMKNSHRVTRDVTHRSSKREAYPGEPRRFDIQSQDFGVGQMSIRIGSAVDRSQASVSSEEMLFDSEVQERNPRKLPAAPVIQPGELGSLPLSDQTHREIRASSAFMDDFSSVAAIFQPEEMEPLPKSAHRHGDIGTPSGSIDDSSSFGFGCQPSRENPPKHKELGLPIGEKDDSETDGVTEASTLLELEPAQEEQSFRLVFENTPQPPGSNWTDSDPIVRDFAYPNVGPSLARSKLSPLSRPQDVSIPDGGAEADDSSSESLASRPRSFGNATNQYYGNHASTSRTQHTERSDNYGSERDPTANSESSQVSDKEIQSLARRKSLDKDKLQPNLEEESIWRSFTMMDEMEDTKSFKARPTSNNSGRELTANQHMDHNAQPSTPKTKPRSPIDDEEQIWRAFIFSDDDNNPTNEWTFESQPPTQSPAPSNPTRTQPSMVAEASTSPIKQNPHLHEASPPLSPSETVSPLEQGFSQRLDSATSHSSDVLAEVSSPTEDPLGPPTAGTAHSETAEPSTELSTTAQRTKSFTFTPWTIPSLSPSDEKHQTEHPPHSSLSAQPPTTTSSSPNLAAFPSDNRHNSLPQPSSSLIAAPASTIYDTTLSSDELHGPSPGPVVAKLMSEHMKVVFTPPKRYRGPCANEPEKTIALGRVLRNGKRVGGQGGGKAKESGKGKGKGRGRTDGEGEGGGDEIVDD
ncbi:hypothetical protein JMJ35_001892 [Cladonia borealis]|uniref:Uncharacterized protein n=1 Tax=Cladonia borealis TaxID=184061 RepID=A0AA39R9M2_9LECA|nr:hypothetical protein JMJ35_001892 [Cladonia borealis]